MSTTKTKSTLPFELQRRIEVTNKQVQSVKKKLMQIREARWLAKTENNMRLTQLLFQNRNRSARMQSRFTIR